MSRVRQAVAAGACLAAATCGSAAAAAATPPRDQLRSFVCQKALDPPARGVSIQAVMRPLRGTAKMQIRFDLLRQFRPGGRFKPVRGHGLGSWTTPANPTLGQRAADIWIVNHPVVNLAAPATYRYRVGFRWLGSSGQRLGSAVLSSPNCYQPELRANLLVRSLSVSPLASGQVAYTAVIANRGLTGAGPAEVDFTPGRGATQSVTIPAVGARSTTRHRFLAPACMPGSMLTVTVDPSHAVDEYNFADNTLTVACPAG